MNKEEMQNKIEQLEKELNILKNKMIKPERWKPYKDGYYIDTNGYIYEVKGLGHKYSAPHNCFRTKSLAELRAKQREAEDELFNIWEHLVGNWRPDWNQHIPKHHFVITKDGVDIWVALDISLKPQYLYFPTPELAMRQYELASDHARAYIKGMF